MDRVAVLAWWGAGSAALTAQTTLGRISGLVTDPSGAPIQGASVTITNTDTQAKRVIAIDEKGFYVAQSLAVGPYQVAVSQTGFRQSRQSGPLKLFLQAAYVGSLGKHLLREPDINFPDFAVYAANQALPTAQRLPENNLRPYRGFGEVDQYMSDSTSNYHSGQFSLSRRAGQVNFGAGYTFAKALGDSSSDSQTSENYPDRHYSYGRLTFDVRHSFTGNFVWYLPRLAGQANIVRNVAGGWQLSGVIRLQTGFFYSVTGTTGEGARRADYKGTPAYPAQQGPNGWWNIAAFTRAPDTRWGNAGVGILEGPPLQNYNLSMTKFFKAGDKVTVRVRADFFNAFNCVNFQAPVTSITNASFGTVSAAYPARQIQLGAKLQF